MRTLIVVFLTSLIVSSAALADETGRPDDQRFVPARFVGGLDAASEKVRFPDYKHDVMVYINCAAKLSADGEIERYFCLDYYGVADTKFRKAAEEFISNAEFSPAQVNGEPKAVEVYFRVFFGRKGELYAAGVLPNWGDDVDKYGTEYETPQRYNEDPPAPKCGSVAGISRVKVTANGEATGEVDLIMSYGVPEHYSSCETWMTQVVRDGRYIPAHNEGKAVTATYVELGGNPEWFTLKKPEGL
jgi:hypothetical protein